MIIYCCYIEISSSSKLPPLKLKRVSLITITVQWVHTVVMSVSVSHTLTLERRLEWLIIMLEPAGVWIYEHICRVTEGVIILCISSIIYFSEPAYNYIHRSIVILRKIQVKSVMGKNLLSWEGANWVGEPPLDTWANFLEDVPIVECVEKRNAMSSAEPLPFIALEQS